jgi:hypothetical protein
MNKTTFLAVTSPHARRTSRHLAAFFLATNDDPKKLKTFKRGRPAAI